MRNIQLLTVISFLFFFLGACRKSDNDKFSSLNPSNQEYLLQKFLQTTDSTNATVKKLISFVAQRKDYQSFAKQVISESGLPLWDKALMIKKSAKLSAKGSSAAADTNYVFVPLVPDGQQAVEGVFACKTFGDSVKVNYLSEKEYERFGFDASKAINATGFISLLMYLENSVFGTQSFIVNDQRIFPNFKSTTSTSQKKILTLRNTNQSKDQNQISSRPLISAYYVTVQICVEVIGSGCTNPAHYGQLCGDYDNTGYYSTIQCTDYLVWVNEGSGGGATGGGTGGTGGTGSGSGSTGGNGGTTAVSSTISYLSQTLNLLTDQLLFLNPYPNLCEELYNYLNTTDGNLTVDERNNLAKSHILYLSQNSSYLTYCNQLNEDRFSFKGFPLPWFQFDMLQFDEPELYSNIQNLKLDAKQAFYLLNNTELSKEINKYISNNSYSEDAKYSILAKLFPEQYPGVSFNNITSPSNVLDDPIINNGISVEDIPQTPHQQAGRRIAKTTNRNNTEDMQFGTNGDISGILTSEVGKDNNSLFSGMSNLFYWCTIRDNQLATIGNAMIERFRTNTAPSTIYENPILNQKVEYSAAFVNFLKLFGNRLQVILIQKQGDINDVNEIDMGKARPIFNGFFNMTNGLQILVNDTEYTEIELDEFHLDINGKWTADVTVTIYDHFGLDKLDALVYQNKHQGFADWWLLQHTRNFVPYITKITVRKRISGHL